MSQLQTSIEFHDSDLSACNLQGAMLVIELRPAYVHKWEMKNGMWIGTGCVQDAELKIDNAIVPKKMPALPIEITNGTISVGNTVFDNLVQVPFDKHGPTRLLFQLVNGDTLDVSGRGISINLKGEATFVEKLPDEWVPQS